jgi:hypothetical protein
MPSIPHPRILHPSQSTPHPHVPRVPMPTMQTPQPLHGLPTPFAPHGLSSYPRPIQFITPNQPTSRSQSGFSTTPLTAQYHISSMPAPVPQPHHASFQGAIQPQFVYQTPAVTPYSAHPYPGTFNSPMHSLHAPPLSNSHLPRNDTNCQSLLVLPSWGNLN